MDIFTELNDIVRWLPDVAADSDMSKQSWNSVKETSTQLVKVLEPIVSEEAPESQMRKAYRKIADSADPMIKKFEAVIKTAAKD